MIASKMVEPQRLIAMSLGKIQACRGQRGGPSLHKSLMVSAVLHKARNIIMMDVMMQARKAEMLEQQRMALKRQETQEHTDVADIIEPPRPGTPLPTGPDAGLTQPEDTAKKQRLSTSDKENNPPCDSNNEDSVIADKETSEPSKCVKRRLESSENCENIPAKRAKSSESNNESSTTESTNNNNQSSNQECAQQISSLVQRFNSGLNGLFGSQKSSAPLQDSQGHDVVSNYCATQISKDSGFAEQMGRPAIALTV